MVGISAINQSTPAIATPEVDHGSNSAIRTVSRSMFRIRAAGSFHAERTLESPEIPGAVLMASVIADPLRGRLVSSQLTRPGRRNPLRTSFRGDAKHRTRNLSRFPGAQSRT
jgi:hypothetical protein